MLRRKGSWVVAATVGLLAIALAVATALAVTEQRRAAANERLASARALAFASRDVLASSPDRALLFALEACRRACDRDPVETYEVRDSLMTALQRAARLKAVHPAPRDLQALAVSPDGRRVAVTTYDTDAQRGSLHVLDLVGGTRRSTPLRSSGAQLVYTPGGRKLLVAGWEVVETFDAETLTHVVPPLELSVGARAGDDFFPDDVGGVSLSSDGRLAAVSGTHFTFNVWDIERRALLRGFPQSRFGGGVFAPNGRSVAAFTGDFLHARSATVWDFDRGRAIGTVPFHLRAFAFSDDGRSIAVATGGGVEVWDVGRTVTRRARLRFRRAVGSFAFDPTGTRLAAAGNDRSWIWNLRRARPVAREAVGGQPIAFGPSGRTLLTTSEAGRVLVDPSRREPFAAPISVPQDALTAFAPDERILVSAGGDGAIRIWDLSPEHPLVRRTTRHIGDPFRITALAWHPDGELLASGGFDGTVRLGVIGDPEVAALVGESDTPTESVQFAADGEILLSHTSLDPVATWDLGGHAPGAKIPADSLVAAGSSAGGRAAVAVVMDNNLRFWDLEERRLVGPTYPLPGGLDKVALSDAGDVVAASDGDGDLYLWHVSDGRLTERTLVHPSTPTGWAVPTVYSLAFSADGSVLVSAAADDLVRLFDTRRGLPLGEPLPADGAAAISRDGTLAAGIDGADIAIWDPVLLSSDVRAWEERICTVTRRGLSRSEWRRHLPGEPYRPACGQ